jgi:hypothetical protein
MINPPLYFSFVTRELGMEEGWGRRIVLLVYYADVEGRGVDVYKWEVLSDASRRI